MLLLAVGAGFLAGHLNEQRHSPRRVSRSTTQSASPEATRSLPRPAAVSVTARHEAIGSMTATFERSSATTPGAPRRMRYIARVEFDIGVRTPDGKEPQDTP